MTATLGVVARVLAEIALALDSIDAPEVRLRRVLELVPALVPARRVALLRAGGAHPELTVAPEPSDAERRQLEEELTSSLEVMDGLRQVDGDASARPPHLAAPITSLDRVLGLIHVDGPPDASYDVDHVRVLSVVAAQIGAFLNTLQFVAEEARRARALAEAHELQSLVSSIVTHDLRSPIMVITTGAHILERQVRDPQLARVLRRILSSARRADRIIADLFQMTRARADGVLSLATREANLVELARLVVEDARLAHAGRDVQLEAPDLVLGRWDPDRLVQALTNLVNNGLLHGTGTVTVRVSLDERTAALAVHNHGPPIPAALLPTLFEPLKRARRRAAGGLGLGLFIVSEIVRAHGGRIEVDSTDERGTTFTMLLPVAVGALPAVHQHDGSGAERPLVLVVDDHPDLRALLCELLISQDYRTAEARDGGEAVELARQLRPDLVIMDVVMPVLDGIQATARLRAAAATSHIPVLAYTSSPAPVVERALAAGCVAAVPKGNDIRTLLQEIKRLVG